MILSSEAGIINNETNYNSVALFIWLQKLSEAEQAKVIALKRLKLGVRPERRHQQLLLMAARTIGGHNAWLCIQSVIDDQTRIGTQVESMSLPGACPQHQLAVIDGLVAVRTLIEVRGEQGDVRLWLLALALHPRFTHVRHHLLNVLNKSMIDGRNVIDAHQIAK